MTKKANYPLFLKKRSEPDMRVGQDLKCHALLCLT